MMGTFTKSFGSAGGYIAAEKVYIYQLDLIMCVAVCVYYIDMQVQCKYFQIPLDTQPKFVSLSI